MSWKITKSFDFCYGHRVWVQKLNPEFSLDTCLACRHLHGHQGQITVELEGELNDQAMVTDFKHLNWFKKFVDETLDHKFIIDAKDPYLETMLAPFGYANALSTHLNPDFFTRHASEGVYYWSPKFGKIPVTESSREVLEGLIIVGFVPTSENLAKWLYDIVEFRMRELHVRVRTVKFNETPKTSATYAENNS